MDPATITLLIGIGTLIISQVFQFARKIHKSNCWKCCNIEMEDNDNKSQK